MIIVKLTGGLGNQMFQYAFARAVAEHHNTQAKFDISSLTENKTNKPEHVKFALNIFPLQLEFASKKEVFYYSRETIFGSKALYKLHKKLYKKQLIQEENYRYSDSYIKNSTSNSFFIGHWQSENYFKDKRKRILNDFTFPTFTEQTNIELEQSINSRNSVAIHVRRGDYLQNPTNFVRHGVCSIDYYKKAVKKIYNAIQEPYFVIFTDDPEWTKLNFSFIKNKTYVDWNNCQNAFHDMQLMSLCKHNIIANSSFSWWGAWLNQNSEKIVIAPTVWFKDITLNSQDIIPNSWITIP